MNSVGKENEMQKNGIENKNEIKIKIKININIKMKTNFTE